jgi:uncharacterized membrane protein YfcA
VDPLLLLGFAATGFIAGFVDAIAGGGALITIPVLISAGLLPVAAFATNKVQAATGTFIAALTYWRRGLVPLRPLLPALGVTAVGAFAGALVVRRIDTAVLQYAVPVALIVIGGYFLLAPRLTDADRQPRLPFAGLVPVMGFALGFYDGLFGPGTGSFMTMGFVTLFGLGLTRAAGHTKALNLTSNLGALVLFVSTGDVVWPIALVMIVGQVLGGYVGARTGIRFGARVIRPLVVVVSVAMALRLLLVR